LDKAVDKAPDAFRTISEVADELDLPQHVLRFWETRFAQIRPMKRGGGRRFYRREDVELLRGIRHLLYGEGYTIRGVQRILKDNGVKFLQTVWQSGAPQPAKLSTDADEQAAALPPQHEAPPPPRGRGLFGVLPLREHDEAPDDVAAVRPPAVASRDDAAAPQPRHRVVPRPRPPDAEAPAPVMPLAEPKRATAGAPGASLATGGAGTLARDHLRKLHDTLHELIECRRLIDAALDDKP
jgi:DNA-binding transcriptional MerR regulator